MTLTKTFLLNDDRFKPKLQKFEDEEIGVFYIRPRTELQRMRRIGDLYDENGNVIKEQYARRRIHEIIDQVCDEKGAAIFNEGDTPELLALDSVKLDPLAEAIAEVNGRLEKND